MAINAILKDCIEIDGEGECHYINGCSDNTIADKMRKIYEIECTSNNVAGVRKQLYGNITNRSNPYSSLEVRVKNLEDRLGALMEGK